MSASAVSFCSRPASRPACGVTHARSSSEDFNQAAAERNHSTRTSIEAIELVPSCRAAFANDSMAPPSRDMYTLRPWCTCRSDTAVCFLFEFLTERRDLTPCKLTQKAYRTLQSCRGQRAIQSQTYVRQTGPASLLQKVWNTPRATRTLRRPLRHISALFSRRGALVKHERVS